MTIVLERRQSLRRRVFKGAKLFFQNYMMSVDCTIRNESENGMQLVVDPDLMLPSDMTLLNRKEGTLSPVQMIWRQGPHVGVEVDGDEENVRNSEQSHIRQLTTMLRS
ncbi:hypothetical protein [uncultured Cohaesibacter sp.]|uniref:hypothetical protein n=1 Tax=uncultured Cohaesibacter sp. TaxID=1002546 RepID=UPI002AA8CDE9|nr:hypothetical protein [uncultured Cohaesibacter sp.]